MRHYIFIGMLVLSCFSQAHEIDIKTITDQGKTLFYLNAGSFSKQENAQQLQKNLSGIIKLPIQIKEQADKKLFIVQVGPVNEPLTARIVKNELLQILNKKSSATNFKAPIQVAPPIQLAQLDSPNVKMDVAVNNESMDITPQNVSTKTTKVIEPVSTENNQGTAKSNPQAEPPKKTESTKIWNIRNGDIRAVVAEVSRVTGKNFVIDPRVQGKISMVSSTPMNNDALYEAFLSVLQVSGNAAIPTGNLIKIVPNIDAKTLSPNSLQQMMNPPVGDDMMVHVVPVHFVPAEQLVPVLRPLMPQWSNVSAYAPSNMIILSGRSNNVKRLASIISQVDNSNANGIDVIPLKSAMAMDVVSTLKELTKVASGGSAAAQSHIMIAADDRSNSVVIGGTKTDRIRLRILINKLDKGKVDQNSNTQVVYLHYLNAQDLVPILAGIAQASFSGVVGTTVGTITLPILDSTNPASSLANSNSSGSGEGGMGNAPTPAPTVSGGAPNTSQVANQSEGTTKPTVQIIAEPNTNSIIINAPPNLIRTLKAIIAQLDIKPAQILIEAMIVEVNENDINNLGIEWGSNAQLGVNGTTNFRNGFAIINSQTNINDFQAQVYALVTKQKANILSAPSVIVLDNRQAKILVGQQVSIAASSYPNNANGTTNGGTPFITFNRQNVALHLYVRPQITRGNGLQLQIDQGNDTLDEATALTTTPIINVSSIVTSVHVESGDILVLGGLTKNTIANNDNNLNILGDIPGIGRLFQHNIRRREKRVLMVFIKPIILKDERQNIMATDDKYNDIREYQLQWIRSQQFNETNKQVLLPNLNETQLPKPFCKPPVRTASNQNVWKK